MLGWPSTVNYSLTFVDRRNPAGIAYQKGSKYYAKDSDKTEFEIRDWDLASTIDFVRRFELGENFWNYKFLLVTPRTYDQLDFTSFGGDGFRCRPNVICLFRLKSGGSLLHAGIRVVRPDPSFWQGVFGTGFRSHSTFYKEGDVQTETLWHELGHALDQLHIKALTGDQKCLVDINADDCYVTPKGMPPNVMGEGNSLSLVNAKPWLELVEQHTSLPRSKWQPTMTVNMPPRMIPLGVYNLGSTSEF
jgi:hypothetical protein